MLCSVPMLSCFPHLFLCHGFFLMCVLTTPRPGPVVAPAAAPSILMVNPHSFVALAAHGPRRTHTQAGASQSRRGPDDDACHCHARGSRPRQSGHRVGRGRRPVHGLLARPAQQSTARPTAAAPTPPPSSLQPRLLTVAVARPRGRVATRAAAWSPSPRGGRAAPGRCPRCCVARHVLNRHRTSSFPAALRGAAPRPAWLASHWETPLWWRWRSLCRPSVHPPAAAVASVGPSP